MDIDENFIGYVKIVGKQICIKEDINEVKRLAVNGEKS